MTDDKIALRELGFAAFALTLLAAYFTAAARGSAIRPAIGGRVAIDHHSKAGVDQSSDRVDYGGSDTA